MEEDEFIDDGEDLIQPKTKPDKVEIIIEPGHHTKNGAEFTSVGYSGRIYGGSGPYDTPEEINKAVEWAKERIRSEGDIPVVKDLRIKQDLGRWF